MLRTLITLGAIVSRAVRLGTTMNWEPPSHTPPPASKGQPSTMAWVTLACGLLSWTFLPVVAGFIGLVVGWMEWGSIKRGESPVEGKNVTLIGLVLSAFHVVSTCIGVCSFAAIWMGLITVAGLSAGAATP